MVVDSMRDGGPKRMHCCHLSKGLFSLSSSVFMMIMMVTDDLRVSVVAQGDLLL